MLKYLKKSYIMMLASNMSGQGSRPARQAKQEDHEVEIAKIDHKKDGVESSLDKRIKEALKKAYDRSPKEFNALNKFAQELVQKKNADEVELLLDFNKKEAEIIVAAANGRLDLKEQVGFLDTALLETCYSITGIEGAPLKEPNEAESLKNGTGGNFSKGLIDGLYLLGDGIDNLIADEALRSALIDSVLDGSIFGMIIDGMKETYSNLTSGEAYKTGRSSLDGLLTLFGTGSLIKTTGMVGKTAAKGVINQGIKSSSTGVQKFGAKIAQTSNRVSNAGTNVMKGTVALAKTPYTVPKFVMIDPPAFIGKELFTVGKDAAIGVGRGVVKTQSAKVTVQAGTTVLKSGKDLVHHIVNGVGKSAQFTKAQCLTTLDGLYKGGQITKKAFLDAKKYLSEHRVAIIKKDASDVKPSSVKPATVEKVAKVSQAQTMYGKLNGKVVDFVDADGVGKTGKVIGFNESRGALKIAVDVPGRKAKHVHEVTGKGLDSVKNGASGPVGRVSSERVDTPAVRTVESPKKKAADARSVELVTEAQSKLALAKKRLQNLDTTIDQMEAAPAALTNKGKSDISKLIRRRRKAAGDIERYEATIDANDLPTSNVPTAKAQPQPLLEHLPNADAFRSVSTSGTRPLRNIDDIKPAGVKAQPASRPSVTKEQPVLGPEDMRSAAKVKSDKLNTKVKSDKLNTATTKTTVLKDRVQGRIDLAKAEIKRLKKEKPLNYKDTIAALKKRIVLNKKAVKKLDAKLYIINAEKGLLDHSGKTLAKSVSLTAAMSLYLGNHQINKSEYANLENTIKDTITLLKEQYDLTDEDIKDILADEEFAFAGERNESPLASVVKTVASVVTGSPAIAEELSVPQKISGKISKEHPTVSHLMMEYMGINATDVKDHLQSVEDLNPDIKDITKVSLNQVIVMPNLKNTPVVNTTVVPAVITAQSRVTTSADSVSTLPTKFMPVPNKGWQATVDAFNSKYNKEATIEDFLDVNQDENPKWPRKGFPVNVPKL